MPTYVITAPDGRKFRVSGPGTQQEALAQVQQQYQGQPAPAAQRDPELPALPGEQGYDTTPTPERSMFSGFSDYMRKLGEANDRALSSFSPVGTLEAAGTLLSGAVAAPILGTMVGIDDAIAGREPNPDEAFARFTYQPRTQSGKDQLAYLGALASPLTESGADVALGPLFAGEAQAARVAPNAARPAARRPAIPGANRPVAAPGAPAPAVQGAATAERQAGLAKVSDSAPSLEQLRADKNAAYKRSEEAGVQISEFSFKKLKSRVLNELGERVDPTLHPDTTAALKRVMDTKGAISLEKLDQLRQIASDAKGAVKPADQRLAAKVVEIIDDYLDGISPKDLARGDPKGAAALKEAHALNTRLKKGEQIEELFRRAEIKAGANFSQSGLENALRQEFKALALDAKKMKRFTPEERAAITKVAKGGKLENALRLIGKLAPVGGMSQGLALIGAAVEPLTMTVTGGALGARAAATRMTMRNANRASETVRRGRNALADEQPAPARRNALVD